MRRQLYLSGETSTISKSLLSFSLLFISMSDLSREHHCNCQHTAFFFMHVKSIITKLELLASLKRTNHSLLYWRLTPRFTIRKGKMQKRVDLVDKWPIASDPAAMSGALNGGLALSSSTSSPFFFGVPMLLLRLCLLVAILQGIDNCKHNITNQTICYIVYPI